MLINEMTGNRIQNNAQSAVFVAATTRVLNGGSGKAFLWRKTVFDAESDPEGQF